MWVKKGGPGNGVLSCDGRYSGSGRHETSEFCCFFSLFVINLLICVVWLAFLFSGWPVGFIDDQASKNKRFSNNFFKQITKRWNGTEEEVYQYRRHHNP